MAGVLKTRFKTRVDDAARWIPKPLFGTLDSLEQDIGVGRAACALLEPLRDVMRTHAGNRGELCQADVPVQTGGAISLWGARYQTNNVRQGNYESTVWCQMEVLTREPHQTRRNPSQVAHTFLANAIAGLLFRKGSLRVRSRRACRLPASKSKKSGSIASHNVGPALLSRQQTSR